MKFRLLRLFLLLAAVSACHAGAPERPNVLWILADDLGIGDVSAYNAAARWRTPAIDRLATQGMLFTDAHTGSALCTPSRYAFLTGRYAWRGRLKREVVHGYDPDLIEPGRMTVATLFHDAGYETAMFGKWHLGLNWVRSGAKPEQVDFTKPFGGGPLAHGFDSFLGISASLDMPPYVWLRNDRAVSVPTGHLDDNPPPILWNAGAISSDFKMADVEPRLVSETERYLRGHARPAAGGKPFFLYLALTAPHTPLLPTAEFAGKSGMTVYGDFVLQVDAHIGRLLAALDETGLAANTIVVVTSDNGFAPAAGLPELLAQHHDPSGGFRGYKSDLFEGGHRVPLIVRWPGRTPAGVRSAALVGQFDFLATWAEMLGTRLPDDAGEDSVSLLPVLRGARMLRPVRDTLVDHSGEGRFALRQGNWKLLLWPGSGGWSSPTPHPSRWLRVPATDLSTLPKYQLYDLAADPAERRNVAAEHPDIVQRMGRLMREYVQRGRSAPGAPQPVELAQWPELAWMKDFE